jgi:REP element-mobilizing transposase RayT
MPLFVDDCDHRRFLDIFAAVVGEFGWYGLSYTLLWNHYHLLLETPEPTLSEGMQTLKSEYATYFNRRYQRPGSVFQGRFKSIPVSRDGHLLELVRYIALNAPRAGVCSSPEEWRWSSHPATLGRVATPAFLAADRVLELFGQEPEAARRRLRSYVADVDAPLPRLRADARRPRQRRGQTPS